ncbi:MAG TPA: ATP-binding protein [Pyrinomonadaceae bacterium]|nr:ATP-binding protein [Pyrinomonadaceae bacterium]
MSLRTTAALALAAVILAAAAALYARGPAWALACVAFAVAGACVALLLTRARGAGRGGSGAEASRGDAAREAGPAGAHEDGGEDGTGVPPGELVEAMMESLREGLLVVDAGGRVIVLNSAARELFAVKDERARGRRGPRLLGEMTRDPAVVNAFAAAAERGERVAAKVETAQGGRVFDLRVAPLGGRNRGEARRGAIGVFFDITRLERLERVRQEFLSNVSHELRTPLTAIRAFAETLDAGAIEEPENNRRFLSIIDRNAARMHSLIDDILELSAIEAGTVAVEPRAVSLRPLVEDVFSALASRADARAVTLTNDVPDGAAVRADPRRLEQMLTNLLDNAVKFSREGGEVRVQHERGAGRDRVSVTDTGEGIAPEHLPRIFERFYRVDRARSRELGGTGLGLAIVKHLARAHGGEATVRSSAGRGSTFTIELPRQENDER